MFRTTDRIRLSRPSPALAVASLALFMASGGVGYAAAKIGSKQIKDNSVQSIDIRKGTIKTSDLKLSTINALKGQTGPAGPAGATGATGSAGAAGAQGPVGPRGPSNARSLRRPLHVVTGLATRSIFSPPGDPLLLTPGSYLVWAKATLASAGSANVECQLRTDNGLTTIDTSQVDPQAAGMESPIALMAGLVVPAGDAETLSMICLESGGDLTVTDASLTVLETESLLQVPVPG